MSILAVKVAAESRDLTTLSSVKEALGLTTTANDSQLDRLIKAASRVVEDYTGRTFAREVVTEKFGVDIDEFELGSARIVLSRRPVLTIQEIRYDGSAIDMSDVTLEDAEAGFVFRTGGFVSTLIERQNIEKVRTGTLKPIWEVDYSGGYVLPSFSALSSNFATTDVDISTDTFSISGHAFVDGDTVRFSSTGSLPAPLTTTRDYIIRDSATNTFKVTDAKGGAALDITSVGSGTHTVTRQKTLPSSIENDVIQLVVSFFRQEGTDQRITSERLGDFQVTYAGGKAEDAGFGIPASIAARLSRWRDLV